MSINYICVILLLNFIFLLSFYKVSKYLNLFDIPDFKRKIHTKKTSLVGGLLFFIFLLIYNVFFLLNYFENFLNPRDLFGLTLVASFFFFLGLYDDKYNLKPNSKLFLMIFFILFLVLFNKNFVVEEITFGFLDKKFLLGDLKYIFTIICVLCFINAANMFDGIDLQFGLYSIFLSVIFIYKGLLINFAIGIILCSIFFLYLNFKKKIFVGNNGTLLISALFSFLIIISYTKHSSFLVEEIFLLMSIPGFDLMRVTFLRLSQGIHMFHPDMKHIHHLLIKRNSLIFTNFLIQTSIIVPVFVYYYFDNFLLSLILSLIVYLLLIYYAKKKI